MSSIEKGRKLISFMVERGWRVSPLNIVYIEDADADTWEPKPEQPNLWNDVRILIRNTGEVIMSAEATTEPGSYYTHNRMNVLGAFRIAIDTQFLDAWTFGGHKNQLALVQCKPVKGYRDSNEDYIRPGDIITEGIYGINQHTTGANRNSPVPKFVDKHSAGCLVGRFPSTHYDVFIPKLKETGKTLFDTAIVSGDTLSKWKKV